MTILCATCGVETGEPLPETCAICADERQWVPLHGQIWTSTGEHAERGMRIDLAEDEYAALVAAARQFRPVTGLAAVPKLIRARTRR